MQHSQKLRIFPAYMHYHKNCFQISFCFQKKLWYPSLYSKNEILSKTLTKDWIVEKKFESIYSQSKECFWKKSWHTVCSNYELSLAKLFFLTENQHVWKSNFWLDIIIALFLHKITFLFHELFLFETSFEVFLWGDQNS